MIVMPISVNSGGTLAGHRMMTALSMANYSRPKSARLINAFCLFLYDPQLSMIDGANSNPSSHACDVDVLP
jgi:hypothetical protein